MNSSSQWESVVVGKRLHLDDLDGFVELTDAAIASEQPKDNVTLSRGKGRDCEGT